MATTPDQPTNGNVGLNLVSGLSTPMVNSMEAIQQEIATTNRLLNIIVGRGLGGNSQTSQQAAGAWGGSGPPAGQTVSNNLPPAASGNPPAGQTVSAGGSGGGTTTSSGGGGKNKKGKGGGRSGDGTFEGTMRQLPVFSWIYAIQDEMVAQRDRNMQYQSVEGGTNAAGFGERFREEGYRLETAGLFSSQEARTAFKGVTALGYNEKSKGVAGESRKDALEFLRRGKLDYGQTVDEGLSALQTSTKIANTSFAQLSTALNEVAVTAGQAGVNARMARQQFVGAVNAAVGAGYGQGSLTMAKVATATGASYGRAFAQQVDLSQGFNSMNKYLTAGQFGLSESQMFQMYNKNPTMAIELTEKKDLQFLLTSFPEFCAFVKQQIKENGGSEALVNNEMLADQIGVDALAYVQNTEAFLGVVNGLSTVPFANANLAATWAVKLLAGQGQGAVAKREAKKYAKYDTATGKITTGRYKGQAAMDPETGKERVPTGKPQQNTKKNTPGLTPNSENSTTNFGLGPLGGKNSTGTSADGKEVDPVIDALTKNLDDKGVMYEDTHVKVGNKIYPLKDAIKLFPNLVHEGKLQFVDKGLKGETVAGVAGTEVQDINSSDRKRETAAGTAGSGQTQEEFDKSNPDSVIPEQKGGDSSGGKFDLTPRAAKLLQLLPDGGGNQPNDPTLGPGGGG